MLSGCPKNAPELDLSTDSIKKMAISQMKTDVFPDEYAQYQCWVNGRKVVPKYDTNMNYAGFDCSAIGPGDQVNGEARAQEIRNRVFYKGQGYIDEVYFKYATALRTDRSRTDFILDLIDIGGGSAIGITKGAARTLQILGTGLTGFRAGRNSSQLRLYDSQTTEVILDQMDVSRSEVYLNFRNNDSTRSTAAYPIEAVFTDLYKYYSVGSQTEAFKRIRRNTASSADTAENAILNITAPTAQEIYTPTKGTNENLVEIDAVKNEFVAAISSANTLSDTEKQKRFATVYTKLTNIFLAMTTGPKKDGFKTYLDALPDGYKVTRDNFLTKPETFDEKSLNSRLEFLIEVQKLVFEDVRSERKPQAEELLTELHRLFMENRL